MKQKATEANFFSGFFVPMLFSKCIPENFHRQIYLVFYFSSPFISLLILPLCLKIKSAAAHTVQTTIGVE